MKAGTIICSVIAVAWVLLALSQLWLSVVSTAIFIKLSITAGLLFIIVLLVSLAIREYISDQKLKDSGYLDE